MSSNRIVGKVGKNNQVERVLRAEIGTSKPVRIPKNSNSAVRIIETTDEFHEPVQTTYELNHGRNPLSSVENNQNQGQSQPRSNYLQLRSKRGMNQKNEKAKRDDFARERLQNKFWLLYLEDHTCSVIPATFSGIQMDPYDRTEVEREQTIEIKLKEKHPNRKDNMWSGVLVAFGYKPYIEKCFQQITQKINSSQSYDFSQVPSLSESLLNSSAAEVPHYNKSIKEILELDQ